VSRGGSYRARIPQPEPHDKCGRTVLWVRYVVTGRKIPIEPFEQGPLFIDPKEPSLVDDLGFEKAKTWTGRRWRCHFESCPAPQYINYRRPRGIPEPPPQDPQETHR
jgi:hypothetical protein